MFETHLLLIQYSKTIDHLQISHIWPHFSVWLFIYEIDLVIDIASTFTSQYKPNNTYI